MVPLVEGGITNVRRERKVLLGAAESEALARELGRAAAPVESRIVTVYFDTPDAALARRALDSPGECVKLRAKAYSPDRSGVPGQIVLEVKRERAGVTSKERAWIAREDARAALGRLAPAFGRVAPVIATSFRRRVFQPSPAWRVTFDHGLAFHAADWRLFEPDAPPWSVALQPPFGGESRVVVELKHGPEGLPEWLASLARRRAEPFSKFAAALAQVARSRSKGA